MTRAPNIRYFLIVTSSGASELAGFFAARVFGCPLNIRLGACSPCLVRGRLHSAASLGPYQGAGHTTGQEKGQEEQ